MVNVCDRCKKAKGQYVLVLMNEELGDMLWDVDVCLPCSRDLGKEVNWFHSYALGWTEGVKERGKRDN